MCIQLYRENTKTQWDTKNAHMSLGDLIKSQNLEIVPRRASTFAVEGRCERCCGVSAPGWMCLPHKVQHCGTNNPQSEQPPERASTPGTREQLKMSRIEDHLNYWNPLLVSMQTLSWYLSKIFCRSSAWTARRDRNYSPGLRTSRLLQTYTLLFG